MLMVNFVNSKQVNAKNEITAINKINYKSEFLNYVVVQRSMDKYLKPILEKWSKTTLKRKHIIYGIRRYLPGAMLWEHTDRGDTHIISAILQVRIYLGMTKNQTISEESDMTLTL